jgi:lipopolysaccharide export system permease protein
MKHIGWMISRMILLRFFAILVGISLFVLTLEVVAYSRDIFEVGQDDGLFVGKYILHRLPLTLSTFLPMSFLLALLLSLTELSYRNEIVAIWSSGISPLRLILILMPLALAVGVFHFVLVDRAVPAAAPALRTWAIADYEQKKIKVGEKDPIWFRSADDIIRAKKASRDGRNLSDVIIFKRDKDGLLVEQIFAQSAVRKGSGWSLKNAVTYTRQNAQPKLDQELPYGGNMRAAAAGSRSGDPEEMTFGDFNHFIKNKGFGIRPTHFYQTWRHKRLTPLVITTVMLALCLPLASGFRRGGGLGLLFTIGIGLGFLFFIFDGVSLSVGELGLAPPWMAAWTPVLVFGLIAAYLTLKTERV